jgi:hypothetical protein
MPSPSPATSTGPSVRLFYFEGYDLAEDRVIRSTRPATREFIDRFHFQAVEENSVEVDPSQVDAFGLLAGDS